MGFICMPCRQKQCNTDSNWFVHGCILEDVDDVGHYEMLQHGCVCHVVRVDSAPTR